MIFTHMWLDPCVNIGRSRHPSLPSCGHRVLVGMKINFGISSGYTSAPTVSITGGGGSGVNITSTISQ